MAKKDDKQQDKQQIKIPKVVTTLMQAAQSMMDKIYQSTYMTSTLNNKDMEVVRNNINTSIDNIANRNLQNTGNSSLSSVFDDKDVKDRLGVLNYSKDPINSIEDLFGQKEFTDNFTMMLDENKSIKEFDDEIDIILRYFPMLGEALDSKKDMVLSADNNSKDFLHVLSDSISTDKDVFINNIKSMKQSYGLLEEFNSMYDEIANYGEAFYYIVPYKKALAQLLNNKKNTNNMIYANESVYKPSDVQNYIIESKFNFSNEEKYYTVGKRKTVIKESFKDIDIIPEYKDFSVQLNISGMLESVVSEYEQVDKTQKKIKMQQSIFNANFNDTARDQFEAPDGLAKYNGMDKTIKDKVKEDDLHVNGAIFRQLKRENIIPIYVDTVCLGYYYIECEFDDFLGSRNSANAIFNSSGRGSVVSQELDKKNKRDAMLGKLSKVLSSFIDTSFINSHQDIKDQLYMILKFNDTTSNGNLKNMKVSYIPPSDIEHCYFELDKDTHRGVSDLKNALVPAKLYICIIVNTALAILTRSFDKRVYYVKQTVDTNISASVQNVLNQIKKGNFGAREISSIKNILGVSGRFTDYVIPMSPTGEAPIQMEVMNGQQINTNDDFVQKLEQAAIEATDMPYEFVQSLHNADYAIRLTMSNGKVIRKAFRRQGQFEMIGNRILGKLYYYEYDVQENIKIELPPPTFLTISNINNLIQNIDTTVQAIVATEINDDDPPELKRIFTKKLMRAHLSTYLNTDMIDRLMAEAKNEVARDKPTNGDNTQQ